jgi:hypothetical protein
MELWRAVDVYNGDVEARNGAAEGLWTRDHRLA